MSKSTQGEVKGLNYFKPLTLSFSHSLPVPHILACNHKKSNILENLGNPGHIHDSVIHIHNIIISDIADDVYIYYKI